MKKTFLFLSLFFSLSLFAQKKFTVDASKIVAPVSPTMWGIFFEDINFAADGGLYAEMIKNRSFEFPMPMMGWREIKNGGNGKILIENTGNPTSANTRFAHITVNAANGTYGLSNEGFRGMGFKKGEVYNFSIAAKKISGDVKLRIEAVNFLGQKIGEATIANFAGDWKPYAASFTTTDTAFKGRVNLWFEGNGVVEVDRLSLFPKNTWRNRPNGMRSDLVQLLYDMKPGFIRFPGGCIVEGRDLTNRYQWKATVGPVDARKTLMNRWNVEFKNKLTPDYYQSFGLGFFEYFQLAEDVGAEPLPILNCGMACQYNSGEVVAMNELDPYIQDALDLIEFANGATTTKWGKLRADMGHPAPFNLKYMGIGNEQWDEQYIERYKQFHAVLKQKHPEIKLVSAAGPSPDGKLFDYAWTELRKLNADLIDEHYYANPDWFYQHASRYDNYDRKGPKVFAGEYAAQSKGIARTENQNTWQCALAEAAFMTGLERNADVVKMASYAPLFAHVDAWQWSPDLIWFNNLQSYGTPNYYVQKLFSTNKGTDLLSVLEVNETVKGKDSVYASAVFDKKSGDVIVKFVNASSNAVAIETTIRGAKPSKKEAAVQVLSSTDKYTVNSFEAPQAIAPSTEMAAIKDGAVSLSLKPSSLTVVRIQCK
ncbi:alpha-L-arabinofuranosidase C-terminal domain-containing protein [Flavisolibacter ginsenosidimutans]|uniref:non-reducing end alpha-L-arabinofuranosidase n=1 Tax=Flavisolibacter ginsenosidimutans TaxID=661481 RepID=A0A5B8UQQ8_9BACT|nr:alpha-L-arabinofuranosidase C-terminal domain-containing protein [Flavisolibacter ginsenosidimutans]QEC58265.1 alpha-L-arabinofuranosidase [Flavisolibacter ginsenosidimutans]